MPECYEIKVKGQLDDSWQNFFPGLALTRLDNGQTLLAGWLPDQSALHGVLERIRDLNLPLQSVFCLSSSRDSRLFQNEN